MFISLAFLFLAGMCMGSFFNVCIYRIPAGLSIVRPGSTCPRCNTPIRFYDNIPVLSYLILGGRCRHCKAAISLRYPMVEALTGLLTLGVAFKFGLTLEAGVWLALVYSLVVITFIDYDHQIIPDVITLPGILVFGACAHWIMGSSFLDIGLGILAGGGLLYGVTLIYFLLRGVQGMGGGDIKLLAMLGTVLGVKGALFTIFGASVLGALVGVGTMVVQRQFDARLRLPFGPFIAAGAVIYIFWGDAIIRSYLGLLIS
ncbi:MAG: prepilin peptidase [Desulfobacterales bacterium]|nr:prepilin peptidase [Desulfobacterales bacterium]